VNLLSFRNAAAAGLLTLVACTNDPVQADNPAAAEHVLTDQVWFADEGRLGDWDELAGRIAEARFVLAGEKHDNPHHHRAQARLVDMMARDGRRPAVVWEMIDLGQEAALRAYLGSPRATPEGMGPAVGWNETGWPDWSEYQPIAAAAFRHGLAQAAGNLPRTATRAVARQGFDGIGDPTAEALARNARWTPDDDVALNEELVEGHCGMMPDHMMTPMNRVQRARDAAMAAAMLEADDGDGAILIAGNGHTRADRGVGRYLEPERRVLSVGIMEVVDGETDPAAYVAGYAPFDVVLFTPAVESPDRCAELRKRFSN
jgi:uncharacterized iron-regulated protein